MNAICARAQGTGSTAIGISAISVAVTITDPSGWDVNNSRSPCCRPDTPSLTGPARRRPHPFGVNSTDRELLGPPQSRSSHMTSKTRETLLYAACYRSAQVATRAD